MGILDLVEDTNPVEENRMALEGSHEAGNLAGLLGQIADSVGEGSIGESTVAVEISVDLADEVVVAEAAAAVGFVVGSADSPGGFEGGFAAVAAHSELAAECRLGERSA